MKGHVTQLPLIRPSQDQQIKSRSPEANKNVLLNEASLLALPVVVSLINLLLPLLFNFTAGLEDYQSPTICTYVAISRYEQRNRVKRSRVRRHTSVRRSLLIFCLTFVFSRNLLLKVSILAVLCYHWLGRVAVDLQYDHFTVIFMRFSPSHYQTALCS